jgi:hypothetical protein
MENKKITEISNEELIKNEKRMRSIISAFGGILLISFAATIFLSFQKGFSAFVVTPIALLPVFIISVNNWKEMKKEIKSRNL